MSPISDSLLSLPAEVFCMIADYLNKTEHKNLRQVARYYSIALIPFVFRTVNLCVSETSFNNILRICNEPDFAKHVKELHYDGRLLPETLDDYNVYTDAGPFGFRLVERRFSMSTGRYVHSYRHDGKDFAALFSESQFKSCHERYISLLAWQNEHVVQQKELPLLDSILARLPSLSRLVFFWVPSKVECFYREGQPIEDCLSSLSRVAQECLVEPELSDGYDSFPDEYASRMQMLLDIASRQEKQISSLDMGLIPLGALDDQWEVLDGQWKGSRFRSNTRLVSKLTELSCCVRGRYQGLVTSLLTTPTSLSRLHLTGHSTLQEGGRCTPCIQTLIPKGYVFSHLTYLSLTSLEIEVTSFAVFLLEHSNVLKHLQLCDMVIKPGMPCEQGKPGLSSPMDYWAKLFEYMSQQLSLRTIGLSGRLQSYNCDEAYVVTAEDYRAGDMNCMKSRVLNHILHGKPSPFTLKFGREQEIVYIDKDDILSVAVPYHFDSDPSWAIDFRGLNYVTQWNSVDDFKQWQQGSDGSNEQEVSDL